MEVMAVRSQFLFPAAVWGCAHPTLPLWALGFMLRIYIPLYSCLSGILSQLNQGGRISTQCWIKWPVFRQTSQTRADSGNFSGFVFFQVWDTISCPCFCKISASNRTMCNLMGTALKGTWKGQHSQYVALLKGQVCVVPCKSYLQKLAASLFLTLTPNCIFLNLSHFLWTC